MNELLNAALAHYEAGNAVIAVTQDKKPYREGWAELFTRRQTEAEVRGHFSNGAHGLAMVLSPASPYAVLDFDGVHADDAWQSTKIALPETALNRTRSGGKHLYFRMPDEVPELKRKVRIVKAACDCTDTEGKPKRCGVDLLIRGFALIPPTPGYIEDPEHPLEDAVTLPGKILSLAAEKPSSESRRTGDATGRVGAGERNVTACSLAGSMRNRGMSIEAIRAALRADNEQRFDPPLTDKEIDNVVKSAGKWEAGAEPEHLSDLGNAQRFATLHNGNVLYSATRRKWIVWNGCHWEWDLTGKVQDLAIETIKTLYIEAANHPDKDMREALSSHAVKSEARGKIESMLALAQAMPEIRTDLERFDRHPFLFNCPNATIDLTIGEGRPHRREDYITKMSPTIFNPDAVCPMFEKFLGEVLLGDKDIEAFVQRAAGHSLTGDTSEHAMFLAYGGGFNGKSSLINSLARVTGEDYAKELKAEVLLESRDNKDSYLAELVGVRMVVCLESDRDRKMSTGIVKAMTGGDRIACCKKYENPFSFQPEFKIWFGTNHKPKINDTTNSIWNRIKTIPFLAEFLPDDPKTIKNLPEIIAAQEAEGVLAWMVRGAVEWRKLGLATPRSIKDATAEYRQDEDIIGGFVAECCVVQAGASEPINRLYSEYVSWCSQSGEKPENKKTFGDALTEQGFKADRVHVGRVRIGLCLKNDTEGRDA